MTTAISQSGADADTGPRSTGSRGTRVLGAVALVGVAVSTIYGVFISPPDAQLGELLHHPLGRVSNRDAGMYVCPITISIAIHPHIDQPIPWRWGDTGNETLDIEYKRCAGHDRSGEYQTIIRLIQIRQVS